MYTALHFLLNLRKYLQRRLGSLKNAKGSKSDFQHLLCPNVCYSNCSFSISRQPSPSVCIIVSLGFYHLLLHVIILFDVVSFFFLLHAFLLLYIYIYINSVALVRERTILTERPPPVGEVSANFCG